jgi:hypothetical protein
MKLIVRNIDKTHKLALFGCWMLRDETTQRRLALRHTVAKK